MLSNRNLDSLILNSEWAIEESFARKEINLYLSYLDLIEKGVALSDLQLHNTKQQQKPYIIGSSGTSHDLRASNVDRKSIAIINLFGTMRVDGNWCSYGIRDTADWIEQLAGPTLSEVEGSHTNRLESSGKPTSPVDRSTDFSIDASLDPSAATMQYQVDREAISMLLELI